MRNNSWCEKYKPILIENILGQQNIKDLLIKNIEDKNIPHLLFYGPSGTGKTLMLQTFIRHLYGLDNINEMVLELDAIDERGIKTVRDRIKNFSKKSIPLYMRNKNINFKLVILEEAETITTDAQTSLRRCIESYSYITRFCIICNDINKIIDPIKSRCCCFYFSPVIFNEVKNKLISICQQEKISYDNESISTIVNISNGDVRKSINRLQCIYNLYGNLQNENIIEYYVGIPFKSFNILIDEVKNYEDNKIIKLCKHFTSNGYCALELLYYLVNYISVSKEITDLKKSEILIEFSNIETRLIKGTEEFIQLSYVFYHLKKILT